MGLTPDDLRDLLAEFERSTWHEMTVTVGGDSLSVSRGSDAAPVPAARPEPAAVASGSGPAPAPSSAASETSTAAPPPYDAAAPPHHAAAPPYDSPAHSAGGVPVLAPSVGLFWHAPSPGAPPFVSPGARVGPDDPIGIVEVMKLMSQVPAGLTGVVTAVLVGNGAMVEHGEPLVLVSPDPETGG